MQAIRMQNELTAKRSKKGSYLRNSTGRKSHHWLTMHCQLHRQPYFSKCMSNAYSSFASSFLFQKQHNLLRKMLVNYAIAVLHLAVVPRGKCHKGQEICRPPYFLEGGRIDYEVKH